MFNITRLQVSAALLIVFLSGLFEHNLSVAQAQIFTGPVPAAMGGAGRAGAEASQIMLMNPASVVQADGMEINFIYQDGYLAKERHESNFAISAAESREGLIGSGGFAYVQKRRLAGDVAIDEKYIFGALAKKIIPNRLSIGVSAFYSTQDVSLTKEYTQWNGSLGILFTPSSRLGFAYVFENPVQGSDDIPDVARLVPQQTLGVHYMVPMLIRLMADVTRCEKQNPDKKGIIHLGGEIMSAAFLLTRFGFEIDDIQKQNRMTLGFGFNGPRLKVNYSFSKPLKESDGAMHSVDMRVPF